MLILQQTNLDQFTTPSSRMWVFTTVCPSSRLQGCPKVRNIIDVGADNNDKSSKRSHTVEGGAGSSKRPCLEEAQSTPPFRPLTQRRKVRRSLSQCYCNRDDYHEGINIEHRHQTPPMEGASLPSGSFQLSASPTTSDRIYRMNSLVYVRV